MNDGMPARSWVESANHPQTDFPLANLPFGVCAAGIGVAIGDRILHLRPCSRIGLLEGLAPAAVEAAAAASLNPLMAAGRPHWRTLRRRLNELLSDPEYRPLVEPLLHPIRETEMLLPAAIGDYTDFYASVYHASNVGKLFRPDNPLLPNYKWVPIGYHGRASSIVVSGRAIKRPQGQTKDPSADVPEFAPTRALDYELEVGIFIGPGNPLAVPIPIAQAEDHIFGLCLVNDWSARDVQSWEYQPLGPFLAKSFATTISPWVVTMEALEPFRAPAFPRPEGDPQPLPYLRDERDAARGAIDLTLEVYLSSTKMRAEGAEPLRVSRANLRDLYWTPAQLVTHHSSNGCNLRPGDLLATGTVSGATRVANGCLLEITRRGADPLALPGGETRKFLEDGDEVTIVGYCKKEGHPRIGFGECRGRIK